MEVYEQADLLTKQAREHFENARQFEEQAQAERKKGIDLQSEAAGLFLPFKVQDVIEYQHKKSVRRMKVTHMRISSDCIWIDGITVKKNGDLGANRAWMVLPDANFKFLQIIK